MQIRCDLIRSITPTIIFDNPVYWTIYSISLSRFCNIDSPNSPTLLRKNNFVFLETVTRTTMTPTRCVRLPPFLSDADPFPGTELMWTWLFTHQITYTANILSWSISNNILEYSLLLARIQNIVNPLWVSVCRVVFENDFPTPFTLTTDHYHKPK